MPDEFPGLVSELASIIRRVCAGRISEFTEDDLGVLTHYPDEPILRQRLTY